MENLFSEAAPLLVFLLPGFLSAWIFYGLTSHPKPGQFERTVEALVFTFVVHAATKFVELILQLIGEGWAIGSWTSTSQIVCSVVLAILLGAAVTAGVNKDTFHSWLRKRGFTSRTSHPSEWFCVLDKNPAYGVLQLTDGRRLTGWSKEWPVNPSTGQFYIQMSAWITEGGDPVDLVALDGIRIHATDVRWVEVFPEELPKMSILRKGSNPPPPPARRSELANVNPPPRSTRPAPPPNPPPPPKAP